MQPRVGARKPSMSNPIFQLIYASSGTKLMSDDELLELLAKSRANNTRRNITGLLLYQDGNFMQVLEGVQDAVLELHRVICADPRHRGVQTLLQTFVPEREFPDWSMSLRRIDRLTAAESAGVSDFLRQPLSSVQSPSKARRLLQVFRRVTGG